jgi:hypothetical protein
MKAAERDTSLSSLVRELLIQPAETEGSEAASIRRKHLISQVLDEIRALQEARGRFFNASARLGRDEIHARKVLRSYEYPALCDQRSA